MTQLLLFDYCKKCQSLIYFPTSDLCKPHQERRDYLDLKKTNHELYTKIRKGRLRKNIGLYRRHKLDTDPIYRIKMNIRDRLKKMIKNTDGYRSTSMGCTADELRAYLEKRFTPEMDWDNYGKIWSVDHVKPLALFDLLNKEELLEANHYTNLQPLLVKDNIRKGKKYNGIN